MESSDTGDTGDSGDSGDTGHSEKSDESDHFCKLGDSDNSEEFSDCSQSVGFGEISFW